MFEKEAEEYATTGYEKKLLTKEQITVLKCGRYDGFRKGAEFGYNKANEWHKVADGDLPKVSGRYLVYTGGEPFILDFATELNSFGYWVVSLGDDWGVRGEDFETVKDRGEDGVIAWKELVPPKESEL